MRDAALLSGSSMVTSLGQFESFVVDFNPALHHHEAVEFPQVTTKLLELSFIWYFPKSGRSSRGQPHADVDLHVAAGLVLEDHVDEALAYGSRVLQPERRNLIAIQPLIGDEGCLLLILSGAILI